MPQASRFIRTSAYVLRPGMPVKASRKKNGSNEWVEIEGVVRSVIKSVASRVRLTVEDRETGQPRKYVIDGHDCVRMHRGYLIEHGITLDVRALREGFFAASKGDVLV
jgi:hypothetical protein